MSSRAIVTFAVGPHRDLLEIALPTFERFADRHGYDLVEADVDGMPRPPSWRKIPALLTALEEYDEVLWLDADTVIVDSSEDVPFSDGAWQAMARHLTSDGLVPNCGVWAVRREMIPILRDVWGMTRHIHAGWWEQSALCEALGYDISSRPIRLVNPSELYAMTAWLDSGWNVHVSDGQPVDRHRIEHATMRPDRAAVMREWVDAAI